MTANKNSNYKRIFIIAGEPSGDVLGADLLTTLQGLYPSAQFEGVGGENMQKACPSFTSIFDMNDIAVMGVAEVLPSLLTIMKRLKQAKKHILDAQPDLVITIDAPDFNFRVVKAVRAKCPNTKFVHYVAPTVWAWRAGRAAKLAKLYDGLLCLLPFEPPYFEKHGLKAEYMGHPAYKEAAKHFNKLQMTMPEPFTNKDNITILFGSRKGEINRHSDIIIAAMGLITHQKKDVHFLIPALPHLKDSLEQKLMSVPELAGTYEFIAPKDRYDAYYRSKFAIAVSGTVGLELALMGVPHLICYRFGAISASIAKRLIKTPYAHLANIVLQKPFIPEFIQNDCKADEIAQETINALTTNRAQNKDFKANISTLKSHFDVPDQKDVIQVFLG